MRNPDKDFIPETIRNKIDQKTPFYAEVFYVRSKV